MTITETIARAMHTALMNFRGVTIEDIRNRVPAVGTALTEAGYAVVPRVPTQEMISAGIIERHEQPTPEAWSLATSNIYRSMIDAAPDHIMPPIQEPGPLESGEGE